MGTDEDRAVIEAIERDIEAERKIYGTRPTTPAPRLVTPAPSACKRARNVVRVIRERSREPWVGLTLGERTIATVRPGGTVLLIGGTGSGKTSLAGGLLREHALKQGPALHVTLELPDDEAVARYISIATGASWEGVLKGEIADEVMEREVPERLSVLGRGSTLADVDARVRELRAENPEAPILVAIDYVQLCQLDGEATEIRARIGQVMRVVDEIARNYRVALLLLSQGSRASAKALRSGEVVGADTTDAGAESADLERWATTTLAIGQAAEPDADGWRAVELSIGKARMSGLGDRVVPVRYHGASGRWSIVGAARPAREVKAEHAAAQGARKIQTLIAAIPGVLTASKTPMSRAELRRELGGRDEDVRGAVNTLISRRDVVEVAEKRGGYHLLWTAACAEKTRTPLRWVAADHAPPGYVAPGDG